MKSKITQSELTIVKAIDPERLARLYPMNGGLDEFIDELKSIGDEIQEAMQEGEEHASIEGLNKLHFMSVCVIPPSADSPANCPKMVVLELGFDGSCRDFLLSLVEHKVDLLDRIFKYCEGYSDESSTGQRIAWLNDGSLGSELFYVGHIGRSAARIGDEASLCGEVRNYVAEVEETVSSRSELWANVREKFGANAVVRDMPRLPWNVCLFSDDVRAKWWFRCKLILKWAALIFGLAVVAWGLNDFIAVRLGNPDLTGNFFQKAFETMTWPECIFFLLIPITGWVIAATIWAKEYPRSVKTSTAWVLLNALLKGAVFTVSLMAVFGIVFFLFRNQWEPWFLLMGAILVLVVVVLIATKMLYIFSRACGTFFSLALLLLTLAIIKWPIDVVLDPDLPPNVIRYLKVWGPFVVLTVLLPVLLVIARLLYIRREERGDREEFRTASKKRMDKLRQRESGQVHSHFAAVASLKQTDLNVVDGQPVWRRIRSFWRRMVFGGQFRVHTLRLVFRVVGFLHRNFATQGWLGTISSIHFARWLIIDNGTKILFLTNYDGGFAAYLGAFSENPGATAIFGHIDGFPRPYFLLWDGARKEQQFIDFARYTQTESLIWYSAYPNITVMDINCATQLCRALTRPPDNFGRGVVADWKRFFKWPITEAQISALLNSALAK